MEGVLEPLAAPVDDVDEVACALLSTLGDRAGVQRVGLALTEGGGRRLRFTASDRLDGGRPEWCHIDAYDDVPLTTVVRTGRPVVGPLEGLDERYRGLVERLRQGGVTGLAAVPIAGTRGVVGALIVFYERRQRFDAGHLGVLQTAAQRASAALDRLRQAHPWIDARSEEDGDGAVTVVGPDPTAAGEARRFLRRTIAAWAPSAGLADVAEVAEVAELCVSELVTNAVVHAGTPAEVRVSRTEGGLRVVVRDRGRAGADLPAPARDADVLDVHGRGLHLVESLASRWGSEAGEGGTTVWFEVDAAG